MVPFLVMLVVAAGVRKYYDHFVVQSVLYGLRGAIIALVVSALISIVTGVYKGLNAWQAGTTGAITIVALLLVVFLKQNPLVALGLSALLGLGLGFLGLWG
jgi:chromate transport protein ChrA